MRGRDIPAKDRLLARLAPQPNGCWLWTGVIDCDGYGRIGYRGRRSETIQRAVYMEFVGPIPDGFHIDHACHNADPSCTRLGTECPHRRCGNPAHLELVTGSENGRRTRDRVGQCRHGHAYTPENTYRRPYDGKRLCVQCFTERTGNPPVRRAS